MKKYMLFPVLTLAGGAGAFALRLMQVRTGFEAATGLPVRGNLWALLLIALLVALAAAFLLLGRKLPDERETPPAAFSRAFSTSRTALLTLPVMGIFLMGASGGLDIFSGLTGNTLVPGAALNAGMSLWAFPSSRTLLLQGITSLLAAVCLFPAAAACRRPAQEEGSSRRSFRSDLLLVPVACLVVRLVLSYRVNSIDPSLAVYYVQLLALVFLTLAFYRLSSFGFQAGRTRRFALYAMPAAVLCIATLADGHSVADLLLYAGGAVTLLGFLLLRLEVLATPWDNN